MPLELLGPLVVAGIALIVLLVRGLGLSRPLRFEDPEAARAAYLHDEPDDSAAALRAEVLLADDGMAALIALPDALGVAAAFGGGAVTRRIPQGAVRARESRDGIALLSDDFGAPRILLRIDRPGGRAEARAMLRRYGAVEEAA